MKKPAKPRKQLKALSQTDLSQATGGAVPLVAAGIVVVSAAMWVVGPVREAR